MIKTLVERRGSWLALLAGATLLALAGWLAVTGLARADVSSLGIGSATVEPGDEVTLNVSAVATDPGVGAYTVDVVYDGSLVDATACTSAAGVCSIDTVGINTVRLTGGFAAGSSGDVGLGSITFSAGATEGTAALTVSIVTLADPEGADILVSPTDGSIAIVAPAATPTSEPTAEPTPTPGGLPPTGGSPAGGTGSAGWLLAGMIGLGLAALGSGAWAVARMRR